MLLLAGDVGGTKTNLAVFSPAAGPRAPLFEASLPSADYPCLEALLQGAVAPSATAQQADLDLARALGIGHLTDRGGRRHHAGRRDAFRQYALIVI